VSASAGGAEPLLYLTDEGEPRAFVIVSSARSGSNLLVSYLRQVSRAACFGEILRGEFPEKPGWDKLVKRLDMPPQARTLHRSDLTAFWELCLAQGLRRREWLGAKVFYYHRADNAVWDRFAAADHRVIHLWRDATFDQYVSRLLAVHSGEWKAGGGRVDETPLVPFDREDYLRYRADLRAGFERTRERYGRSPRYEEIEYRQLSEQVFVEELLQRLFGERIDVEETLRRQRGRPKLEYLADPDAGRPFSADSLSGEFAPG
jgi:LPS sulfotransferase NodH